jgi:molecular chaperone GrpE
MSEEQVGQKEQDNQQPEAVSDDKIESSATDVGAEVAGEGSDQAQNSAAPELDELIALKARLDAAEQQVANQKEEVLRSQAEMQNVRRRAERDVENAHKFALEKFVAELLPVIDSLERGLDAVPEDDPAQQASREGLSLTLKMFLDVLQKFQVEQLDPQGESFNPELHQAMSMQENDAIEPNTVMAVLQKGFTLSGRLVRPAMVMVSKAPATAS